MAPLKDHPKSLILHLDRQFDAWADRKFPRLHRLFRRFGAELSAIRPRSMKIALIIAALIFLLAWWIES